MKKTRKQVEALCKNCKFSHACGWHLWYCELEDDTIDENGTCDKFEED